MIVPDRKTESYLNEPATPKAVARLCRAGVVAPTDFLQAAALCRTDGGWEKGTLAFLRLSTALFFAAALFFLTLAHWDFLYRTGGFAAAAVLFGGCACLRRRFAAADYAGVGLIILMYFLPDIVFMSGASARADLLACAVLSGVWAISSGRAGIRLSPFVLLNAAFCFSGNGSLFLFAAVLNAAVLIVRERFREHATLSPAVFRLFFLGSTLAFLFAATAGNSGVFPFVLCLTASAAAGYVYTVRLPDAGSRRLTAVFNVMWVVLGLFRLLNAASLPLETARAITGIAASALIAAELIVDRLTVSEMKGNEDAR